jgi:hypothetical protein
MSRVLVAGVIGGCRCPLSHPPKICRGKKKGEENNLVPLLK